MKKKLPRGYSEFCRIKDLPIVETGNAGTRFLLWGKNHVFVFRLREFEEPWGYQSTQMRVWSSEAKSGLELWICL